MKEVLLTRLRDRKTPLLEFRSEALERVVPHLSPNKITLVGVIAATPGITNLKKRFPVLRVIVATEDPELNAQAYIVPGLGDFGDRFFGTV